MATRTIANGGGAWATDATWVEGAAPTAADEVVATATSGNLTLAASGACRSIDLTGYTGTFTHNTSCTLSIGDGTAPTGNNALIFPSSGWTYTLGSSTTSAIAFVSTSATQLSINPGGKTFGNTTFNGAGGSWALAGNILGGTDATVTFTAGSFDANGLDLTFGLIASSNTNVRSLTLGTGTWTITGNNGTVVSCATVTNLTLTRGNPIVLNYSGSTGTRTVTWGSTGPTEANAASFKITAGTDTLACGTNSRYYDLFFDGFAGTVTTAGRTIFGDFTITSNSSGMTVSASASATTFASTSGTKTVTSGGKMLDFPITFNGVGGTWQLADNLTLGATRTITLTNGTLDFNSRNVSTGNFASSGSGTRVLNMGSGTLTLTRATTGTFWNTATATNLTINPGTCAVTIAAGDAASNRTINGSPTFYSLACAVMVAQTLTFTDGTTTAVTNSLTLTGSSGQLLTLQGSSTGGWTLAVPATQSISYVSVSRSTATGNTAYAGATSTDGLNNVNWSFVAAPTNSVAPSCAPSTGTVADTFTFASGTWTGSPTSYETSVSVDGGAYSVIDTSAGGTPSKTGTQLGGPGSIATRVRAQNAGGWSGYVAGTTLTVTAAGGSGSRIMLLGVG